MAFKFPFTNYHELNLTWVLEQLKKLFEESNENVETIESYEDRLSAVETELPTVEATANQADTVANAAASLAQTAKSTADTANENALTASAQAGLARQEAATAEAEAQAATQAAQQAQATVQDFDGRITQAEDDASEALQEAQSFENRVNAAINTANNAANTATIAQGIAVNANQNAATALDTAQTADGKAEAAQDAAQIADGKAEAAQDAADVADGKAEAAQDTADTNAANIGNLANLTTTAKNNLVAAINEAAQTGGGADETKAPLIVSEASGAIASFDDGANNMQIQNLVCSIEPVQAGAGDPSPTNIRPISGHTGMNVTRTGKNLFDKDNANILNAYYATGQNQVIHAGNSFRCVWLPCKPNTTYTIINPVSGKRSIAYTTVEPANNVPVYNAETNTTTTGTDAKYIVMYVWNGTSDTVTFDDVLNSLQIVLGSIASTYEPYTGNQISVTFPSEAGTVYGGTLTLNSNRTVELNDLWIKPNITGWDLVTTMASGFKLYRALTSGTLYYSNSYSGEFRCNITSIARNIPSNVDYTCVQLPVKSARYLWAAVPPDYDMSNFEIVYKVYEPDVMPSYAIIANQMTTLYGQNNVWTDVGAILSCKYPADTKLYIDGKVAELQALILEN